MRKRLLISDRYELGEILGRGGMGVVYSGADIHTGQPVAVKQLAPEMIAGNPELVERFAREAEALGALNHSNIVKVLATAKEPDVVTGVPTYYLIMENVPGGSLRDLLDREGRLGIASTLEIALDLADALTRAHRLKIIHRDFKPANILMTEHGTPRLTDFGLARFVDVHDGRSPRLTQMGTMMGTVDYLSPEACQGEELDTRSDIWAFGVTLYEMVIGQRPFSGPSLAATLAAILTQPVPDMEALRPDTPVALVELVYRMLEKNREARIPSVRLVGAELEVIMQGPKVDLSLTQRPVTTASRFATPSPHPYDMPRHNLPLQAIPFVGRESELTELARLFADPNIRLVNILGSGGMGKTRLAVEATAAQLSNFKHGVYFVPLGPLNSANDIIPAIAEAVGFQFYEGDEPKRQLLDYLRQRQLLLVVDNFEHVLDGARLVVQILGSAPGVKVLATSREKLNLQEETRFRLDGMDFPDWQADTEFYSGEGSDVLEEAFEYSAVKLSCKAHGGRVLVSNLKSMI